MKLNQTIFILTLILGLSACRTATPQNQTKQVPRPIAPVNITNNFMEANTAVPPIPLVVDIAPQTQAMPKAQAVKPAQQLKSVPVAKTTAKTNLPTPQAAQQATMQSKAPPTDENIITDEHGRLTHPWSLSEAVPLPANIVKPSWFGESLKFDVSWAFINAGEAQISTGRVTMADGQKAYEIKTLANSYSVLDTMFKVRDINISWLDLDASKSLGYWQSVREGKYARDEWIVFDYKNNQFITYKKNRHGEVSTFATALKKNSVFDILTALFFIRMQPLPVKGEIYFNIVNGGKEYPLKVMVHGKQKVKVKAGTFDCIVVEPLISGEGIFVSKGKSLKVWLTDDEYKMPVKMSVEVFIGSVKAELTEYTHK